MTNTSETSDSSPANSPMMTAYGAVAPLRVLSLESRRADEMRSLIERHGGVATVAPSMREIPLDENPAAFAFGEELLAGRIDIVVFLTGVGATALMESLETRWPRAEILSAMERCTTVVRGPKPTVVLNKWGLRVDHRAPEPNTWRELLSTLTSAVELSGRRIAIQEYGKPSVELYRELEARGASLLPVPVYRWALPTETAPLREAVQRTIAGEFDLILFTSAQQLHSVLEIASETGQSSAWLAAANRCVVASIGPTATETLIEGGLNVDVQPSHPKMGPLVKEALEAGRGLIASKRAHQ